MLNLVKGYVRVVDNVTYRVGRFAMYLIFAMIGVLLYSSYSKTFSMPALWTLETAQFLMVAYYLLGGGYSMQMGGHVRMDLFYGSLPERKKNWIDVFTILFLIFYLCVLFYGGISSTTYALEYGERSYSAWRPYMAPIKIIMCIGIFLTLLQAIAIFFKDVAKLKGIDLGGLDLEEKL
ncbi:MAG: TRAP transporter small permease subunit [Alphaproteobacteria bacterium]|nr:TRAP transporter small permease subunit [Alphaproteobacteria bacterium]